MKTLLLSLAALFAFAAAPALAATCPSVPYTFTDGTTAEATQVNTNFSSLLNCMNVSLAPLASPAFTGTATGVNLSLSGTLGVTGATTLSGNASVGGTLSVTGTSTYTGKATFNGGAAIVSGLTVSGGATISTGGLTVSAGGANITGGLTFTGALTAPAGSVVNADLDSTVAAGSCGTTTTACALGFNAQGRITSQTTVATHAAMSTSTAGDLETNDGANVKWAKRASLYAYSCSSGGCVLGGNTNASLTRLGVGHYTISFTNAFPNTNFSFLCTLGNASTASSDIFCIEDTGTGRTTTSDTFWVVNPQTNPVDTAGSINVMVLAN